MVSTADSMTDDGGGLRDELRGDAKTVASSATQRLQGEIDARKGGAVNQVQSLSSAIGNAAEQLGDDTPQWLRSAFEQGARTLDQLAQTVQQKNARELGSEAQRLARENPGTFLASCAVAGFAAARVLKAGGAATSDGSSGSDSQFTDTLPQPSFASATAPAPEAVS